MTYAIMPVVSMYINFQPLIRQYSRVAHLQGNGMLLLPQLHWLSSFFIRLGIIWSEKCLRMQLNNNAVRCNAQNIQTASLWYLFLYLQTSIAYSFHTFLLLG